MRTKALRYGIGAMGVLLAALACDETESDGNASGTEDSSVGGSANSGSGGSDTGNTATTVSSVVTNTVAVDSGPASTASSTGGSPSTTTGTAMVVGAGGVVSSDTTSSSLGGTGGAGGVSAADGGGGAPPITECLGCETSTEPFGEGCQVWVCFSPGDGIQRLIDAGCEDLGTQVPRYCCPPDVELDCD